MEKNIRVYTVCRIDASNDSYDTIIDSIFVDYEDAKRMCMDLSIAFPKTLCFVRSHKSVPELSRLCFDNVELICIAGKIAREEEQVKDPFGNDIYDLV